jgi:hypothetical protein
LTTPELIEKVEWWVKKLCDTGAQAWSLRVPVDFDHDPDMLILEVCARLRHCEGLNRPECLDGECKEGDCSDQCKIES